LGRKTTDCIERGASHSCATAAEERGIPVVLSRHYYPEEKGLLRPNNVCFHVMPVLKRIDIVKVLRGLDKSNIRIFEIAECPHEIIGLRHVVGIEYCYEVARTVRKRIVEIAGLGMFIVHPREIFCAELCGKRRHLRAISIIEEPGRMGIMHVARGHERAPKHLHRLIIGRDKNVNLTARERQWGIAMKTPPRHETVE